MNGLRDNGRRVARLFTSLVVVVAVGVAVNERASASPVRVASVLPPDGESDIRTTTLIGPSGQVYVGDGAGRWVRKLAGGVAADVTGATRAGKDVLVAGISTPLYRFDGTGWAAVRLGQTGKTVLGRGPVPAVAAGKHVFVEQKGKWVRVGQAPGTVTALWASSTKRVFLVTAAGVHSLRGTDFVRTRAAVDAIVGGSAWGISAEGAIDVATGRQVVAAIGSIAATGGNGAPWMVTADGTGPLRLVGRVGGKPSTIDTPLPPGTAIAGVAADRAGHVVIVSTAGDVHLWTDGAWSTGSLVDELPAAKPGAGPAPTS